jgi:hypothetical protein
LDEVAALKTAEMTQAAANDFLIITQQGSFLSDDGDRRHSF